MNRRQRVGCYLLYLSGLVATDFLESRTWPHLDAWEGVIVGASLAWWLVLWMVVMVK